ncbi:MAG: hypothetical protein D6759_13860 [Chloroflexi bacterium]|nr:MAG: hypothetical protein D6759_13860 [Chloroflexota bacterium]
MDRLRGLLRLVSDFTRTEQGRRLEKIVGTALLVGSLLFLSAILVRSWPQIAPYLGRMNGWLLVAGQACTLLALLLGGVMWSLIQAAFGLGFGWREGIVIHLVSGITKYIPGYAWQYMSKAYLSRKRGASPKRITMAMLTEFILLLAGGLIAAVPWGMLAPRLHRSLPLTLPLWGWPLIGVMALAVVTTWNATATRLVAGDHRRAGQGPLWSALGAAVVGWMAVAAAAWLMSRALYPVSLGDFPQHVIALVVSGIVSLLVIIVPSGLGVREMTLALLLTGTLPLTLGVMVSILVRLSVVLGELMGLGVVLRLGLYRLRAPERGEEVPQVERGGSKGK